jgi:ATP-dependent helicase/nuclease subunit B
VPRVFTIPPGVPFLPALADAVMAGTLVPGWPAAGDPLSLSEGTIYLPTRRAARALATLLAARAAGDAVLLPRIVPLGDVDEAEENLLVEGVGSGIAADASLPPEVSETARRLALAELILAWARQVDRAMLRLRPDEPLLVPASPADALALAGDLGRLIDSLAINGLTCDDVHRLVPDEFGAYWRITRDFLAIAAEAWPRLCAEQGVMDGAMRRYLLLTREAERLDRERPGAPVVAAGSTGSMPATAALLAAIARLPRGAVVLPGLDTHLDDESWRAVLSPTEFGVDGHPGHPQAILARLVQRFGLDRTEVPAIGMPASALAARDRLVSEALRPAGTTHAWADVPSRLPPAALGAALADVAVVEAADDREEAATIAVVLRETLRRAGESAALVTPDRALAERVAAELGRWGIRVDDSAGRPFDRSPAGMLARLAAEVAARDAAPAHVIALLAHPLCRLGLAPALRERGRAALEIGVLRGPAPAPGLDALAASLEVRAAADDRHAPRPRSRLGRDGWDAARAVVEALRGAFAGFARREGIIDIAALAPAHEATCLALMRPGPGEEPGADAGEEALAALFDEVRAGSVRSLPGRFDDYPSFFGGLGAGRTVPRPGEGHRRIKIWGLLEARLLCADTLVLGGLDEKVWPPETRSDAFLNRPMRRDLHLPAPERRIGQTAHDFAQAMGAPRVVLTRAAKRGGDPTVASRFLQRLQAVAGPAFAQARRRGDRWLRLARSLDAPVPTRPLARPEPRPGPEKLPTRLSVTEIETLVRDPYAVYAKHVLGLDPLDPVAVPPGVAVRGSLVHDVLGRFAQQFPDVLPPDARERIVAFGREAFAAAPELFGRPDIRAFWWPRFLRMAEFAAGWEAGRRVPGTRIVAERGGKHAFTLADGSVFTLTCRADRIELLAGGGLAVIDFKTGNPPGVKEVRIGFAPQLTLEAAMAKRGAFDGVPAGERVAELVYVRLSGGMPAGVAKPVKDRDHPFDPDELAEKHLARLVELLDGYRSGERGFRSRTATKFARRYNPYDHLARFAEWSATGGADAGGGEEDA